MNNLRRELETYEYDRRFRAGKSLYQRDFCKAGVWEKSGRKIQHRSFESKLPKTHARKFKKTAVMVATFLKRGLFDDFRILLRCEQRKVFTRQKHIQEKQSIYIEVNTPHTLSFLTPLEDFTLDLLQTNLDNHQKFFQLPLVSRRLKIENCFFSPAAFGYLLHEGLGHRHEADDHSTSLKLTAVPEANFSVVDSPGNKKLLGYTPVDDFGVKGKDVVLLDGKTGHTNLMTAKTGNSRSTHFEFHPLIRQRCLIVKTLDAASVPSENESLQIHEVRQGSWNGEWLELEISKAIYIVNKNRQQRMAPFVLRMKPELVASFQAFGESKAIHPAGGCHKGAQRGLDVSFFVPAAYLSLKNQKNLAKSLELVF